jgi:Cu2+-containing amine oxidase
MNSTRSRARARRYEDSGRVRPVLHRASIVEIAVPYAEPRAPFHKKCAFDVVDYGLGYSCSSLELGCDCLGHIHYFDATLADSKGARSRRAVCSPGPLLAGVGVRRCVRLSVAYVHAG